MKTTNYNILILPYPIKDEGCANKGRGKRRPYNPLTRPSATLSRKGRG